MKITYLGQAGLLFETNKEKIIIDPYLSNSVAKVQSQNYRRVKIDESFLQIKPTVVICTHDHLDHLDKETLCHYFNENSNVLVLAPYNAWQKLREFGGNNNYVMFNAGTTWTKGDISFRAVVAEHSDREAIGVIICAENKNYYVTGDTLYSEKVFDCLPKVEFEVVFLPINGFGNNMNAIDAKRFSERINVKYIVPVHIGMFDFLTADIFQVENKITPTVYKEIIFKNN